MATTREENMKFGAMIRRGAKRDTFSVGKDGKTRSVADGKFVDGNLSVALRRAVLAQCRRGLDIANASAESED